MKKPGLVEIRGAFFMTETNGAGFLSVERPERSVLRTAVAKGSTMSSQDSVAVADACPGCLVSLREFRALNVAW